MNQPRPAASAGPAPAAAPAAAPPPATTPAAAAPGPKPVFRGTMVGVAPPGGFLAAPPAGHPVATPQPAPAPATAQFGSPAAGAAAAPGFRAAGQPQFAGAVNPLGGTVALPQAPAAYGLPVGNPLGAPPQGAPIGAPPQGAPMGAPPGAPMGAPMGAPPGAFPPPGAAPGQPPAWGAPPYGPPPDTTLKSQGAAQFAPPGAPGMVGDSYSQQGGYPMQQGYPQQGYPGAMVPGVGAPLVQVGVKGKMRNPVVCLVLAYCTCGVYAFIGAWLMLSELKAYLGKPEINLWHFLIPVYGLYLLVVKVPEWVTEAKVRAGSRNPSSAGPLLYLLLGLYFLPKDLNEIWDPSL